MLKETRWSLCSTWSGGQNGQKDPETFDANPPIADGTQSAKKPNTTPNPQNVLASNNGPKTLRPCRKKPKVTQPGDWRANRTRPQYKTHPIAAQTAQDPNTTPQKDSRDKTDPIAAQTAHDPSTTPQKDSRERRLARQILRQHINNENKFQIQNNYKTNPL